MKRSKDKADKVEAVELGDEELGQVAGGISIGVGELQECTISKSVDSSTIDAGEGGGPHIGELNFIVPLKR